MLADYFGLALGLAFPALVVSVVLYYAAAKVNATRADRRRRQRQVTEESHRRKVYADRYAASPASSAPSGAADDAGQGGDAQTQPVLRPVAPSSTARPFGSEFMTMSDLRSRITGPSGGCIPGGGGCCG
ncbi:hypothetical protein LPJ61_004098 [Coemansia biformis]|uniref:Uncharacterized protein n=1 Tax=Coemansia biformis TaxID=1286918 RepID=A0A9W7YA02_9FUNG|nr:hypothetical protein LPJ61_004098 [Coemansia biformis]